MAATALILTSCTSDEPTPEKPSQPEPAPEVPGGEPGDTIAVKLGYSLNVTEENITARSAESRAVEGRDLIGVTISKVNKNEEHWGRSISYAFGVFDDIDKVVFKLVKGTTYCIQVNYYPDAKEIVYKYPDGHYGAPFSNFHGTTYTINEPEYTSEQNGDAGIQPMSNHYQATGNYTNGNDLTRGKTPIYMGQINEIKIGEENSSIEVPLELCLMGITLKCNNFTSGKIAVSFDNFTTEYNPGDEMSTSLQILPNYYDWMNDRYYYDNRTANHPYDRVEVYYKPDNEKRYLLAAKTVDWKPGVNYVFNFNLEERADGSFGLLLPSEQGLVDEEAFFD